ncbi:MAG: hypothetical protein M3512_11250 [Bacteroidota bacterium]|nr:hypothetical protein [Bacteroidota bacterium]
MLSLQIYKSLPIEDKTQYLWYRGKLIGSRYHGRHKIELYSIFNFYAEIWYTELDRGIRDSMIIKIIPFNGISNLDPYLENIKFEILNC